MTALNMTTPDANRSFLPEDVHALVVQPVTDGAVSTQVARTVSTSETAHKYRVPILSGDPSAEWVAEAAEISPSKATLDEDVSAFFKLAGLTVISRELGEDTNPAAAETVGKGLARDISRKLDAAFFGSHVSHETKQPRGLLDIAPGVVDDVGTWADVDPFIAAIYGAESEGASLTSFVAHPDDALALAQLKESTGSNKNLLQPDPTAPTRRLLAGVPLVTSTAVEVGTVWGIPRDRVLIAIRDDVRLEIDRSVFFTSDQWAVKATLRVATLFPHPGAIQKIMLSEANPEDDAQ